MTMYEPYSPRVFVFTVLLGPHVSLYLTFSFLFFFCLHIQIYDTDMYEDRHAHVCVIMYNRIVGPRRMFTTSKGT